MMAHCSDGLQQHSCMSNAIKQAVAARADKHRDAGVVRVSTAEQLRDALQAKDTLHVQITEHINISGLQLHRDARLGPFLDTLPPLRVRNTVRSITVRSADFARVL